MKKIVAIMCAATIGLSSVLSTTISVQAEVLESLPELAREAAAEGCVLVENDNNTLPYAKGTKISVFGRGQLNYYRAGVGSGGGVRTPYDTTILDGMRANPNIEINSDLVKKYEQFKKDNPDKDSGGSWGDTAWCQEEMPMTDAIVNDAKNQSDAAVIIISRTAGEDREAANAKGSYLLTDRESEMIEKVTKKFDNVTVVLNVAHIMDMKWVDQYGVESVLYVWQGGMTGGDAVADILTGEVNPSGRLTDTIAVDYEDYPASKNFGNKEYNNYQEDIYVGYRYFETFAKNDVVYPFGYGLSYTSFDMKSDSVTTGNDKINVSVTVKNTGKVAGKQVVQVYYGAPIGQLGNPAKELAAFAKTRLLQPGETQKMTLSFNISDMASYDDSGVTGHESAYVLEAGDYKIYLGENVRTCSEIYTYKQAELKVIEQLTEQMAPVEDFERMVNTGKGTPEYEKAPKATKNMLDKANENTPEKINQTGNKGYKLIDVYNGKISLDEFVGQFSNEQLAMIVIGEKDVNNGASTMGATTDEFKNVYGFPFIVLHDGPSGIKYSEKTTCVPNGTALACTWNTELVEDLYQLVSEEMSLNKIDNLLGPGLNIHRNPLTGRNFEYQSEDPLVTGMMGAAIIKGIQYTGASATPKHFVANNQENYRRDTDARVSERALREIYLKGFEIAVKSASPHTIMTAYNAINGTWAASNSDMVTNILREEWGWNGMVMTDWWCQMNRQIGTTDRKYASKYLSSMIKAQTDIYMIISYYKNSEGKSVENDVTNGFLDGGPGEKIDIPDRLKDGYLKTSELQRSVKNICNYMMKTAAFADANNIEFKPNRGELSNWFDVETKGTDEATSFYSIEAEAAALVGNATITPSEESSNGYYVGELRGNDQGVMNLKIDAEETERRTMKVYYATIGERKIGVTVNNGHLVTKKCVDVGSWSKVGEPVSMNIALRAGQNTIEIAGEGDGYAPNIDRIELEMTDTEAAGLVTDLISQLPNTVTDSDKAFVYSIKELYESLVDKTAVANIDKLQTALQKFGDAIVVPQFFWMEAEVATLGGGATLSNATECVNGYQVGNLGGEMNATATFKVTVEEAGKRALKLYYCQDDTRSYGVQVNNGAVVEVACEKTPGWTVPNAEPVAVRVELQKGENTIVIGGVNNGNAPNLDSVEIELTDTEIVTSMNNMLKTLTTDTDATAFRAMQITYDKLKNKEGIDISTLNKVMNDIPAFNIESEVAELDGGAAQVAAQGCSNGYYVGNLGGAGNASATFRVQMAKAGMQTLKVYYMSAEDSKFGLVVNDAEAVTMNCVSTGGEDTVSLTPLLAKLDLKAGENVIKFTGVDGEKAPNIDRIEITLSETDAKLTVEKMITTLPETVTEADKAKVMAVKMAYEDLTDATNVNGVDKLQAALKSFGEDSEITIPGDSTGEDVGDNSQGGNTGDDTQGGDAGDDTQGGDAGDDSQGGNTGDNSQGGNAGDNSQGGNAGDDSQGGNAGDDSQGGNAGDNSQGGNTGDDTQGGNTGDDTKGENSGDDTQKGNVEDNTQGENSVQDGQSGSNTQNGTSVQDNQRPNNTQTENGTQGNQVGDNSNNGAVVQGVKVSEIQLTGISGKIAAGKMIQLNAKVYPENVTNPRLNWTVDDERYATVDQNGLVKMTNAGKNKTVIVTAESTDGSGVKATYKIKIMPKAVKQIKLVALSKSVKAGKSIKITAIINPLTAKNKVNKTLEWSTNNKKFATVTKNGLVKTKKAGKGKIVKITAKATDGSKTKATISLKLK